MLFPFEFGDCSCVYCCWYCECECCFLVYFLLAFGFWLCIYGTWQNVAKIRCILQVTIICWLQPFLCAPRKWWRKLTEFDIHSKAKKRRKPKKPKKKRKSEAHLEWNGMQDNITIMVILFLHWSHAFKYIRLLHSMCPHYKLNIHSLHVLQHAPKKISSLLADSSRSSHRRYTSMHTGHEVAKDPILKTTTFFLYLQFSNENKINEKTNEEEEKNTTI